MSIKNVVLFYYTHHNSSVEQKITKKHRQEENVCHTDRILQPSLQKCNIINESLIH